MIKDPLCPNCESGSCSKILSISLNVGVVAISELYVIPRIGVWTISVQKTISDTHRFSNHSFLLVWTPYTMDLDSTFQFQSTSLSPDCDSDIGAECKTKRRKTFNLDLLQAPERSKMSH